ncbi:MAG: RagB/SusD family nutrient uptake outer membrane protein [Bacteroidales bacterium]|nr:RagB/SusD family nutrient uptake outer membrane protein [Bacteroidales bacterium]
MKNINFAISILICAVFFSSCTKFLDLKSPSVLVPEDAYNTVDKCGYGIGGLMANFTASGFIARNVTVYGDLFCDNATTIKNNAGHFYDVERWNISTSQSDMQNVWAYGYITASQATDLIIAIDNLIAKSSGKPSDIKTLEVYKGAALSVKAYCEWLIVQYYCLPYSEENKNTNGIILIGDSKIGINEDVHTSKLGKTYDHIVAEINNAIEFYKRNDAKTVSYKDSPSWQFLPSLSMAYILKGRVMLDLGRNNEAIGAADSAILYATDRKIVSDKSALLEMYRKEATPTSEDIWTVYFDIETQNSANSINNFYNTYGGYISIDVHNLLESVKGSDIRYALYPEKLDDSLNTTYCLKYANKNYVNNVPVMRIPEAYYIKAEAQAKLGNIADAKESVFEVIGKRNSQVTDVSVMERIYGAANTTDEMIDFILNDKRREFAGEGLRWFDLRRNFRRLSRTGKKGENINYRLVFTNYPIYKMCLPIPDLETQTRQWKGDQNEVWANGSPNIDLPTDGEDYSLL